MIFSSLNNYTVWLLTAPMGYSQMGPKFGTPSVDYIICRKFTVESNSCNTFVVHNSQVRGKKYGWQGQKLPMMVQLWPSPVTTGNGEHWLITYTASLLDKNQSLSIEQFCVAAPRHAPRSLKELIHCLGG